MRAVDTLLFTGSTVAAVHASLGEALGVGLSSLYRHARHRHDPTSAVSIPLPAGEAPADALRALLAVQTSQLAVLDRADAAKDAKTSAVASDRIRAVTHELVDLAGIDAAAVSSSLDAAESIVRSIRKIALRDTAAVYDLADLFREVGDHINGDELVMLADNATAYLNRN